MEILNISLWKANGYAGDIGIGNPDDYGLEDFDWHLGAKTMADALKVYDKTGCEFECGKLEYVAPLVVYQGDDTKDDMPLWLVKSSDGEKDDIVSDTQADLKDYVAAPTIAKAEEAFKEQFMNPEKIEVTSVTLIDYIIL